LIHVYPSQSVAVNFLNCTKNTELTARPFARTFTLAPSTKKLNPDKTRTVWIKRHSAVKAFPVIIENWN